METENEELFTVAPFTVTAKVPVVAPVGTVTTIEVAPQLEAEHVKPFSVTVLIPCGEPKLVPVMVTEDPTAPEAGEMPLIVGAGTTVKLLPLLFTPLAYTTTFPVVAADGTVMTILVALQPETAADVPLKLTLPVPWLPPKFVPVMVTDAPGAPVVMERLEIEGAGTTVKLAPLLSTPLVCTTTFPVAAPDGTLTVMLDVLQVETVAEVPANLTVPEP